MSHVVLAVADLAASKRFYVDLLGFVVSDEDSERLYLRGGWQRVGVVPDYAMWPGGGFCDTTFFWKKL